MGEGRPVTGLVSVVTLTRNRPGALERAMASVAAQAGVEVEHVVIGDDCPFLSDESHVAKLRTSFPSAVIRNVSARELRDGGMEGDGYLPSKLAHLRNLGIEMSRGDMVAQLDDDNAFRPGHLRSLRRILDEDPDVQVAHSWRNLLDAAGRPYLPDGEDPWHPDPDRRRSSYAHLRDLGVFEDGSNVVRDTLTARGQIVCRVDTSEFLVRRELHRRIPFPVHYTRWRRRLEFTEDMAFSHELIKQKIRVECSRKATLDYYMGGYSNLGGLGTEDRP
ncbi:glycosyltransferase family 2 protein [Sphaerisporangium album]|uniref:Glycosyltransferase family 2 protein n=1 Tax=Sphaerisporangium album TaxID=509200 RepID=A0A367FLF8_9ACTN|nr:glycosyltransferase family A protein [Sphaerisporangium album]RCG30662.1 glycosyltransferase family 2 protein [Sphaerisporangium album]